MVSESSIRTESTGGADRRIRIDTVALVVSSGLNSVLGVLFWFVAAHLYSPEAVGRASTLLTTSTGLASLASVTLAATSERFLPLAGRLGRRLMVQSQALAACVAALLAFGFLAIGPSGALFDEPFTTLVFLIGTPALAVYALQDSLLVAVKLGRWSAARSLTHSILKLVVIVALSATGASVAISGGWLGSTLLLAVIAGFGCHHYAGRSGHGSDVASSLPPARSVLSFSSLATVWMFVQAIPGLVIPLMVFNALGPAAAAVFNVSWSIVVAATLLITTAARPYVSEAARPGAHVASLTRRFIRMMLLVGAARALAIGVAGPLALILYGPEYADLGIPLLIVIGIGALISTPAYIYGNVARVDGRITYATGMQAVGAVLLITTCALLIPVWGLLGVAIAYAVHDLYCTLATAVPLTRLLRRILKEPA